ncbi:hypothetical protein AALO_G00282090, partial [Alosa alosa]
MRRKRRRGKNASKRQQKKGNDTHSECKSFSHFPVHLQRGKTIDTSRERGIQCRQAESLTGGGCSRQMLKCLGWLGLTLRRAIRVSPMNSLWVSLSSSHTDTLRGGEGEHTHTHTHTHKHTHTHTFTWLARNYRRIYSERGQDKFKGTHT